MEIKVRRNEHRTDSVQLLRNSIQLRKFGRSSDVGLVTIILSNKIGSDNFEII